MMYLINAGAGNHMNMDKRLLAKIYYELCKNYSDRMYYRTSVVWDITHKLRINKSDVENVPVT